MDDTIKRISENLTLAREMSMVGNYESAEVHYEGTLQLIMKLVSQISEPLRKDKWQDVRQF